MLGFPGPYSKYVERILDAERIIAMMRGMENRNVEYREHLAYYNGRESKIFVSKTKGKIALAPDGKLGYNFNRIFIKNGAPKTMFNFSTEERIQKYNNENWNRLVEYLDSEKQTSRMF